MFTVFNYLSLGFPICEMWIIKLLPRSSGLSELHTRWGFLEKAKCRVPSFSHLHCPWGLPVEAEEDRPPPQELFIFIFLNAVKHCTGVSHHEWWQYHYFKVKGKGGGRGRSKVSVCRAA